MTFKAHIPDGEFRMHASEALREHTLRNLETAIDRLRDDFERVEFWAAALNAFLQPIPPYETANSAFLLRNTGDAAAGSAGPLRRARSRS
jgi:hypothetical protein